MNLYAKKILRAARRGGRRLQHWIDDRLTDLTEQGALGPLDQARQKALVRARQALLYELEGRSGAAQTWEGEAAGPGGPLRVAFLGDTQSYKIHSTHYLQHILFQEGSLSAGDAQPVNMPAARGEAARRAAEVDMVIAEVNDRLRWQPEGGVWRWMPTWVRMVITFRPGEDWESVEKRMQGQKRNMRHARKAGFTFTATRDRAAFDHFYERMYLPMMNDRHGDYGALNRPEELLPYLEKGMLLLACKDGQAVAGGLMHIRGRSMFGMVNGVLDSDPRWYEQGAVSYFYQQSIRWSHENGFLRFDAGGVRPFLKDGLYQYKARWGMQPVPDLWLGRSWLFWARPGGSGEAWLREHPALKVEGVIESPNLAE